MPIAPPPTEYRCPRCDWHTVHRPRSDAIGSGGASDFAPQSCPRCGHLDLEHKFVAPTLAGRIGQWLKGR